MSALQRIFRLRSRMEALLRSLPAFSITVTQVGLGSMSLSWTPPTQNTDGSALTDLAGYKLYYGTVLWQLRHDDSYR